MTSFLIMLSQKESELALQWQSNWQRHGILQTNPVREAPKRKSRVVQYCDKRMQCEMLH